DMQFAGQTHVLTVGIPRTDFARDDLVAAFERAYWQRFEVELREMRAQVVSLRTAVVGRRRPIAIGVESGFAGRAQDSPMSGPGGKPAAERRVWFDGDWHGTAIFRREHLPPGAVVQGPAIVEQMDTTTVIEPRDRAHVDAHGNLEIAVR